MSDSPPVATAATDGRQTDQPLVAEVIAYEDGPDECTLSPLEAAEHRETTAWLTARGDAFVSLAAMR